MMNKVKIKILEDNHYVLRRLSSKGINIYNVEINENGYIYTINYHDLDKIPFDIEVLSFMGIKGLLFYAKIYKHFLIAILISIMMLYVLSNVIISVEVIHNDKTIREMILDELYDFKVHPFMFKKSYSELQDIKEKIKDKYPENIEWLEIIDDGMKYTVRVEERIITKEEEKPLYCDIESTKDAIVLTSQVTRGQNLVSYNDFVKNGSILVSGKVVFNNETKSYVCAEGIVYGNTWYTVNVTLNYEHNKKNYTGKISKNITLLWGSKEIPLLKVHFDNYDIEKKALLELGRFTLYKEINREYTISKTKYSYEEAVEQALIKAREKIKTNLPSSATIIDEKVLQTNNYDSIIEMDIFYSVKEIIGKQVEKNIEGSVSDETTG